MLVTQIISSMTVTICMLVDSIMIGRFLGVEAMAAYGLSTPILLVFAAIGAMLSAALQVCCSKSLGAGDKKETNTFFTIGVVLAGAGVAVCLVLLFVFINPVCSALGAEEGTEVFRLTRRYLIGFLIGAPPFIFAQIMVPFMQMSGSRTRLVAAVIAMTVADIALDLVNVLIVKRDTLGMGLASSLSYYIACGIGIVYFFKKDCLFKFRLSLVKGKKILELLKQGIPTIINQLSLVALTLLINQLLLATPDSTNAVAAYSVISTCGNICYSFGAGIGAVSMMLASTLYIEEDRNSLREIVRTQTFYSIVLDVAVIILFVALAGPVAALFLAGNTAALKITTLGIRLFVLCLVSSALNTSFKNYYQGINRVGFSEFISFAQNFLFTAIFAFVLGRLTPLGSTGIFLSFFCGETTTLVVWSLWVFSRQKKFSFAVDNYAYLPENFGEDENHCLEMSITAEEDIIKTSKESNRFCEEHGKSPKICYYVSLCIEEMAYEIFNKGFADGKGHRIDVRLLDKGSDWLIRIRDNCESFDVTKYLELYSDEDPLAHIGVKMVSKLSEEMKYLNTMGLNNLTINLKN